MSWRLPACLNRPGRMMILVFTGGDKATADKIWGPFLGGKYVITPEHIRGKKDLHFFGKAPTK